jgi:NTP pyrophosphatase (non-canonical NTP hydrolase)
MTFISHTSRRLAWLSEWIDQGQGDRDSEAVTWGRISKITEEAGEVIGAFIGATGQNPRKGVTHTDQDVLEELLDVAVTALGAVEHMTGNQGSSMTMLEDKVDRVYNRAQRARVALR